MAAEEMAKGFWADRVLSDPDDDESWVQFRAVLQGRGAHQARLAVILALEEFVAMQGGSSDLNDLAGELGSPDVFGLRNLALYSEVHGNDEVWSPSRLIGNDKLQALTQALRKSVTAFAIIVEGSLESQHD